MPAESKVRVMCRFRPLFPKESLTQFTIGADQKDINFNEHTYSFDALFPAEMSQSEFYQSTASPMLKPFLDGYNVTIMAYGQTGSGKSFSMGTGEDNLSNKDKMGLIPRFVSDLYDILKNSPNIDFEQTKVEI